MRPRDIELQQRIEAPLEQIWNACASAKGIANWQADEARGEARRGGKLTLHWAAFDATVELDILDFIPYQRMLVSSGGTSTVEFRFEDNLVTLTHRGLGEDDDAEGLSSSWRIALAQLAHSLERHAGRRRRVHWLVRPVSFSPESLYLCFTDPNLLELWLTQDSAIPAEGMPYALKLKNGLHLSGQVLTNVEGRDLALSCESRGDAVLTLRSMPSPIASASRLLALVWSEWGPRTDATDELLEEFDAALDRLVGVLGRGGAS
jgi:uncharacterized protein YndB with AHSA1/START domain